MTTMQDVILEAIEDRVTSGGRLGRLVDDFSLGNAGTLRYIPPGKLTPSTNVDYEFQRESGSARFGPRSDPLAAYFADGSGSAMWVAESVEELVDWVAAYLTRTPT